MALPVHGTGAVLGLLLACVSVHGCSSCGRRCQASALEEEHNSVWRVCWGCGRKSVRERRSLLADHSLLSPFVSVQVSRVHGVECVCAHFVVKI